MFDHLTYEYRLGLLATTLPTELYWRGRTALAAGLRPSGREEWLYSELSAWAGSIIRLLASAYL